MAGGLMQLVAQGAQDIYLTGNPQITFFKVVYRRHTPFSMETIEQTINGSSSISATASTGTVTVSRNGDLLGSVYVCLPGHAGTASNRVVSEAKLEIGGQEIDKQTTEWMELWNELSTSEAKATGLKALQGAVGTGSSTGVNEAMVPLTFWFCRNPGLYLPLIALQYHEVKIKLSFGTTTDTGLANEQTVEVWADYVYLDTDERRRFAQVSHEYLIEQVQHQTEGGASTKYKLNFNHPVKALYWTDAASITTQAAKLTLNGHDRFAEQTKEYFQLRQPYQHHTAVPRQNLPTAAQLTSNFVSLGTDLTVSQDIVGNQLTAITMVAGGVGVQLTAPVANGYSFAVMDDLTAAAAELAADPNDMTVNNVASTAFLALDATADIVFPVVGSGNSSLYELTFTGTTTNLVQNTVIVQALTKVASVVANAADAEIPDTMTLVTFDRQIFNGAPVGAVLSQVRQITPDSTIVSQARTSTMTNNINVYSFALKPEEHQPSGTCNFSRIDTAHLNFNGANVTVANIYALNYNVLRIMSGMGGLAYSN